MGAISTKPMICNHCGEDDLSKLVTKHGKHERICRKCKYARKKANQETENGESVVLDKVKAYCRNGCKWWRWVRYQRGTKPDKRVLCPSCQDLVQGNIDNCGMGNAWSFDR